MLQTTVWCVCDHREGENNKGCPINRSLKVSYSSRLREIKVELQLVQVHLLLFTL